MPTDQNTPLHDALHDAQKEKSMLQLNLAPRALPRPSTARSLGRWLVSFVGFPLGGLAAMIVTGPVDTPLAAVTGGLLTGAVLGTTQALALRFSRRDLVSWALATATGLAAGLTIGASAVDFQTSLGDLVLQGAISGFAVGATQALVLARRTGPIAFLWPAYLAAAWAIGWAVTTAAGVGVDEQFTIFGATGAVAVTLLTAVLPLHLHSRFPAVFGTRGHPEMSS